MSKDITTKLIKELRDETGISVMQCKNALEEAEGNIKKALAIYMNKHLIRELFEAITRIKSGDYVSEEEFFKNSPLRIA